MSLKFSELFQETKTVTMEWLGKTLNLKVAVAYYTPEFEESLDKEIDDKRPSQKLVKWILSLVKEWDLLQDDGTVYPLEEKAVNKLPTEFLGEVVRLVTTKTTVGEKKGGTSDAT